MRIMIHYLSIWLGCVAKVGETCVPGDFAPHLVDNLQMNSTHFPLILILTLCRLSPTYTSGKMKAMFSTLVDCGSTLQGFLEKLADNNELLDVCEIAACHSTNVTASVAFGN